MGKRRREPHWLTRIIVDAIHDSQIREHGGLPGVRGENVLESALTRPRNKWHYDEEDALETLAAAYAFGLVRNHPYRDGDKRIGFLAMFTFLGMNGVDFVADEAEVVSEFLALADGRISEKSLADWIRTNSVKAS